MGRTTQSYEAFLALFFENIPDALLKDLVEDRKRLFYDPNGNAAYAAEHNLEPMMVGLYLGELKSAFEPSPACIERLAEYGDQSYSAMLDEKGSWLFLCKRDAFGSAIVEGVPEKGKLVLVYDERGAILGYGTWAVDSIGPKQRSKVVIKNKFDMGQYLRKK